MANYIWFAKKFNHQFFKKQGFLKVDEFYADLNSGLPGTPKRKVYSLKKKAGYLAQPHSNLSAQDIEQFLDD